MGDERQPIPFWLAFLSGALAGGAGAVLLHALLDAPDRLDPSLIRASRDDPDVPPTVIVPGLLGSELRRPDGSRVWLDAGNAVGQHDLTLPLMLPPENSSDELVPGGLLGVDTTLPRLFGFTEYADLVRLLEGAGIRRDRRPRGRGAAYHVFSYDWRRDLVDAARRLHGTLERFADDYGDPDLRFNVIGHSMGGLVARYYLRYGTTEPGESQEVTWAGARRIRNLVLVASPNGGSLFALDALLQGSRVGFSSSTLARSVIARMAALYQLVPPAGVPVLIAADGTPDASDLHDPATWERFGWGPWHAADELHPPTEEPEREREFVIQALARSRAFHAALARRPAEPCPARVVVLGGDCLPTQGRAVVPERPGLPPRLEPLGDEESRLLFEAGDGRVTRASVLASHLAPTERDDQPLDSGLAELSLAFFGAADHHGIYQEPTFQSVLLRLLLRPARKRLSPAVAMPRALS